MQRLTLPEYPNPLPETKPVTDRLGLMTFHQNSDGSLIGQPPCPRPGNSAIVIRSERVHPERWSCSYNSLIFDRLNSRSHALWIASAFCLMHLSNRQYDHADEAAEDALAMLMQLGMRR